MGRKGQGREDALPEVPGMGEPRSGAWSHRTAPFCYFHLFTLFFRLDSCSRQENLRRRRVPAPRGFASGEKVEPRSFVRTEISDLVSNGAFVVPVKIVYKYMCISISISISKISQLNCRL